MSKDEKVSNGCKHNNMTTCCKDCGAIFQEDATWLKPEPIKEKPEEPEEGE